jgi:outer membrane protein OmpA-like peptidoglycan-associated protein
MDPVRASNMTNLVRMTVLGATLACVGPQAAFAEDAKSPGRNPAAERANFIACPMVRNTYVPCWVTQHEGELYYLGPQGDLGAPFHPPQLKHKALIEGVVSDEPRICGGIVLNPVKVSVLPELDESCNTILPADGHADPPHHRTPGPSNSEREERRRPGADAQTAPAAPKRFDVPFAFDVGQHLYSRDSQVVGAAARYVAASKASKVEVVGYRGGALLSNGTRLMEQEQVGTQRAEMIRKMLIHAGVPESNLKVRAMTADAPDGVDDFELRRATITVTP